MVAPSPAGIALEEERANKLNRATRDKQSYLPRTRIALALAGLGGLVAAVSLTSHLIGPGDGRDRSLVLDGGVPQQGARPTIIPIAPVAQRPPLPHATPSPQDAFAGWAHIIEARTGVPARALAAYAVAQTVLAAEQPDCHLAWATLAGIGQIESLNGQLGGGLLNSGRPLTPILGVALDGVGGISVVSDTDSGKYDNDSTLDRAVGPLQFLPTTWQTWAADGDGDGLQDPQDIDDSALAAARYLCASGDLATALGWQGAVFSYNHSLNYVSDVRAVAEAFAQLSTQ